MLSAPGPLGGYASTAPTTGHDWTIIAAGGPLVCAQCGKRLPLGSVDKEQCPGTPAGFQSYAPPLPTMPLTPGMADLEKRVKRVDEHLTTLQEQTLGLGDVVAKLVDRLATLEREARADGLGERG